MTYFSDRPSSSPGYGRDTQHVSYTPGHIFEKGEEEHGLSAPSSVQGMDMAKLPSPGELFLLGLDYDSMNSLTYEEKRLLRKKIKELYQVKFDLSKARIDLSDAEAISDAKAISDRRLVREQRLLKEELNTEQVQNETLLVKVTNLKQEYILLRRESEDKELDHCIAEAKLSMDLKLVHRQLEAALTCNEVLEHEVKALKQEYILLRRESEDQELDCIAEAKLSMDLEKRLQAALTRNGVLENEVKALKEKKTDYSQVIPMVEPPEVPPVEKNDPMVVVPQSMYVPPNPQTQKVDLQNVFDVPEPNFLTPAQSAPQGSIPTKPDFGNEDDASFVATVITPQTQGVFDPHGRYSSPTSTPVVDCVAKVYTLPPDQESVPSQDRCSSVKSTSGEERECAAQGASSSQVQYPYDSNSSKRVDSEKPTSSKNFTPETHELIKSHCRYRYSGTDCLGLSDSESSVSYSGNPEFTKSSLGQRSHLSPIGMTSPYTDAQGSSGSEFLTFDSGSGLHHSPGGGMDDNRHVEVHGSDQSQTSEEGMYTQERSSPSSMSGADCDDQGSSTSGNVVPDFYDDSPQPSEESPGDQRLGSSADMPTSDDQGSSTSGNVVPDFYDDPPQPSEESPGNRILGSSADRSNSDDQGSSTSENVVPYFVDGLPRASKESLGNQKPDNFASMSNFDTDNQGLLDLTEGFDLDPVDSRSSLFAEGERCPLVYSVSCAIANSREAEMYSTERSSSPSRYPRSDTDASKFAESLNTCCDSSDACQSSKGGEVRHHKQICLLSGKFNLDDSSQFEHLFMPDQSHEEFIHAPALSPEREKEGVSKCQGRSVITPTTFAQTFNLVHGSNALGVIDTATIDPFSWLTDPHHQVDSSTLKGSSGFIDNIIVTNEVDASLLPRVEAVLEAKVPFDTLTNLYCHYQFGSHSSPQGSIGFVGNYAVNLIGASTLPRVEIAGMYASSSFRKKWDLHIAKHHSPVEYYQDLPIPVSCLTYPRGGVLLTDVGASCSPLGAELALLEYKVPSNLQRGTSLTLLCIKDDQPPPSITVRAGVPRMITQCSPFIHPTNIMSQDDVAITQSFSENGTYVVTHSLTRSDIGQEKTGSRFPSSFLRCYQAGDTAPVNCFSISPEGERSVVLNSDGIFHHSSQSAHQLFTSFPHFDTGQYHDSHCCSTSTVSPKTDSFLTGDLTKLKGFGQ